MKRHPDRGGSHQAMVELVLAFEILSDSATRRRYDDARRDVFNQGARTAIDEDILKAKQKAQQYPRTWEEFEVWIKGDFANAQYGKSGLFPTISNSTSGCLFMIGAAVIGFIIVSKTGVKGNGLRTIMICVMFAAVGLHQLIGKSIGKSRSSNTATNVGSQGVPKPKVSINCQSCGQQLRVEISRNPVRLRCPKCKFEFDSLM